MLRQKKMSEILNFEQQRIYQQNMNVIKKCPNFIRTIVRHLDNLLKWLVRMGNTGVWGNDPGICKRKKMGTKQVASF